MQRSRLLSSSHAAQGEEHDHKDEREATMNFHDVCLGSNPSHRAITQTKLLSWNETYVVSAQE